MYANNCLGKFHFSQGILRGTSEAELILHLIALFWPLWSLLRYEWPTGVASFGCTRPVLCFYGDVCNLSDDLLILSGIRCWWGSQCPQFAIKVNSWAVIKCVSVAHNQGATSPRVTAEVKGDCSDFIWPLITEFFTCTCCAYYEKNKLKCHLWVRHCMNTVLLCDMGTSKH